MLMSLLFLVAAVVFCYNFKRYDVAVMLKIFKILVNCLKELCKKSFNLIEIGNMCFIIR